MNRDLELEREFFAAHSAEIPDVAEPPRQRSLPRHRARRTHWKPEPMLQPQHAIDRDALVG